MTCAALGGRVHIHIHTHDITWQTGITPTSSASRFPLNSNGNTNAYQDEDNSHVLAGCRLFGVSRGIENYKAREVAREKRVGARGIAAASNVCLSVWGIMGLGGVGITGGTGMTSPP